MNQLPDPCPIPVGHFADIGNGQRIHYHDVGQGEPVIFLHGAGGGASSYSNFKGNYPAFAAAGFRCIVADMLGFGLSSKPDIPQYDLDFFVDGVHRLVKALGLQQVTLLGNSLGGAVSLGYALAHPDEVKRLILMAPGGVEDIPTYLAMPGIANMFAVYKAGKTGPEAMREVMRLQLFDPCPVFGFWGVNDQFNPVGGAMKIIENAPQARLMLVNRCGHWVQVEHQEMFNRACIDFLRNG